MMLSFLVEILANWLTCRYPYEFHLQGENIPFKLNFNTQTPFVVYNKGERLTITSINFISNVESVMKTQFWSRSTIIYFPLLLIRKFNNLTSCCDWRRVKGSTFTLALEYWFECYYYWRDLSTCHRLFNWQLNYSLKTLCTRERIKLSNGIKLTSGEINREKHKV